MDIFTFDGISASIILFILTHRVQVALFQSAQVGCCIPPLRDVQVEAPPGSTIGGIRADYGFTFHQWFSIYDSHDQTVLKITKSRGQFFAKEIDFKVCSIAS